MLKCEKQIDYWRMPAGIQCLGRIIAAGLERGKTSVYARFAELHLTTNFDPLLKLAVARQGGTCVPVTIPVNGGIPGIHMDACSLIHLHGRWDSGETLHTNLNARRGPLESSLRALISKSTIVVLGYGGWEDVFMNSLKQLVAEGDRCEVLWGFFDLDMDKIRRQRSILSLVRAGSGVTFYRGVDTNRFFLKLERQLQLLESDEPLRQLQLPPMPLEPKPRPSSSVGVWISAAILALTTILPTAATYGFR